MNARQTADNARRALEFAEVFDGVHGEEAAVIRSLKPALEQLLAVVEAQGKQTRVEAQRDEEFRGLLAEFSRDLSRGVFAIQRADALRGAIAKLLTDGGA
ncbi:hypothetical protein [Streptomyces noursei]|uniref:hypothetical protein n=1 Tax=Streptomyces noursei TaxID=1971 RepID=UPI0035DAD942